jgi:septal ring factor EnvC (AmiA/AmiB activator)
MMRGSLYTITEIILFLIGASLLGLLLGLLIRRPRPQTVKAAAAAGPERIEVERRLAAAQARGDDLESKLNATLAKIDNLQLQNTKLEELRAAEATMRPSADIAALEERAGVVDRLEDELAKRDSALAEKERELAAAARRIASLEGTGGTESAAEVEPAEFLPPRQNPTGPGAFTDVIEFEVGGAD